MSKDVGERKSHDLGGGSAALIRYCVAWEILGGSVGGNDSVLARDVWQACEWTRRRRGHNIRVTAVEVDHGCPNARQRDNEVEGEVPSAWYLAVKAERDEAFELLKEAYPDPEGFPSNYWRKRVEDLGAWPVKS